MIMIEGQDVMVNATELTGEPDSIKITPLTKDNYRDGNICTMLAKTLCEGGVGKAIVVCVGPTTVAGAINEKT